MSERAGSTVIEVSGSHAIYVSRPAAVAALIHDAATAVSTRWQTRNTRSSKEALPWTGGPLTREPPVGVSVRSG
jgi:hypothetical protein